MTEPEAAVTDPRGAARVLAVFRHLASFPEGAPLGEITAALGSRKTNVHRALAALRDSGLVSQDPEGRYRYSHELFRLVFSCYDGIDEVARIRPVLGALAHRFGEATHYAVLDGSDVVYLAKIQSQRAGLRISSTVGGRVPAHCTALGKVLLACSPPECDTVGRYITEHAPLIGLTERTITNTGELIAELEVTRQRGYALDQEESEVGIHCVAIPLFLGSRREPSGAISLTALAGRMPVAALEEAVPEIVSIVTDALGDVVL
jgi:DNA-binding IclR family transcriptional regulator